jgi:hypothetical protein
LKRKEEIVSADLTNLEKRIYFKHIFGNFNKLAALIMDSKLNIINRSLVFINYLLFVSLFILIHFSIEDDGRNDGDVVYLVIAIVYVYLFSSPFIKQ